jgi:hypothetical protein
MTISAFAGMGADSTSHLHRLAADRRRVSSHAPPGISLQARELRGSPPTTIATGIGSLRLVLVAVDAAVLAGDRNSDVLSWIITR